MLNLIRCEFWKLKRKMFVQLVLAASFLFPIPLTAIIYYLNTAQNKYATKAAAFDALWQSVIGFGMLLLLPCILGIVAALLFFMERDNDTFKNLRTIPITSSQMVIAKCIVLLLLSMLPIIVLTSRYKGSFLVGVIVAFVYGFIGMFANGTLQSIYPVSAALGLINYRAGAEGVMWNKGLCFISILIMCAIGIALMFVKQKPEKREAKKTQHTAPKKGW